MGELVDQKLITMKLTLQTVKTQNSEEVLDLTLILEIQGEEPVKSFLMLDLGIHHLLMVDQLLFMSPARTVQQLLDTMEKFKYLKQVL